jgi:catechol 2,3-dioxygenase-like lactoylglutathione lyase family enzyme
MAVSFDHTIIHSRSKERSATFLAEILGRPAPATVGPFRVVELDNGVSLDFIDAGDDGSVEVQHYAFLIGESDFDEIFGRIRSRGIPHWADPARSQPGEIYRHAGGRGVYFQDPDGHLLEILTRPHGSG